jgi:hypothetical protein
MAGRRGASPAGQGRVASGGEKPASVPGGEFEVHWGPRWTWTASTVRRRRVVRRGREQGRGDEGRGTFAISESSGTSRKTKIFSNFWGTIEKCRIPILHNFSRSITFLLCKFSFGTHILNYFKLTNLHKRALSFIQMVLAESSNEHMSFKVPFMSQTYFVHIF